MRRVLAGTTTVLALLAAVPSRAEPAADWTVTIGAEARLLPSFLGAGDYTVVPFPLFDVRRAGTPPRFHSPRDGFGFGILDSTRFQIGPAVKLRLPRREGDDDNLRGLGDVDWAVEAGGFIQYWPTEWLRARAELRQGFGGHHGVVADFLADAVVPVTPQLTLSGGPRLTLATAAAENPYFGVTPAQSVTSGLPVYDAGGGVRSFGVGGKARYQWSPQWASHVFVEYERLVDGAADSPVVTMRGSPDQIQVGLGLTYSFDMHPLW